MVRPSVIEFSAALYQPISRGHIQQLIFLDTQDRHTFLQVLPFRDNVIYGASVKGRSLLKADPCMVNHSTLSCPTKIS